METEGQGWARRQGWVGMCRDRWVSPDGTAQGPSGATLPLSQTAPPPHPSPLQVLVPPLLVPAQGSVRHVSLQPALSA